MWGHKKGPYVVKEAEDADEQSSIKKLFISPESFQEKKAKQNKSLFHLVMDNRGHKTLQEADQSKRWAYLISREISSTESPTLMFSNNLDRK